MSMIIGPESSGSAMARDSSIAILQMPLLPIARNSRASMRSRCRRRGPKYGFVPIQTATFKLPGATRAAANSIAITPDGEACETTPSPSWYFGEARASRFGPELDLVAGSKRQTSKTVPFRLELPTWLPRQLGYQQRFRRTRAKRDRERVYSLAARGKIYAALALFNRLIAGPNGRSASQ
jgi:hypothetical protein